MKQIETQTYIHLIVDGSLNGDAVEQSNTPCGARRRNTSDFGYDNVSHTFDRGYTLHEHYDGFDLINMNGRLYDPILGRMFSPDIVIQDEQSSQAYNRYSYCFNNPLRFTDPSGYVVRGTRNYYDWNSTVYYDFGNYRSKGSAFNTDLSEGKFSPIYDVNGYFLGTDDEGLQGEAIVMRREDFKQGMSHEEAISLATDLDENHKDAEIRLYSHYSQLKNRPDWDGYLTLSEANDWYRNGNGEALFVDASLIDLDPIFVGDIQLNEHKYVNYASLSMLNFATGLVYGTLKLTGLNNDGIVRIGRENGLIDNYGFEMHPGRPLRNFKTKIGGWIAGKGVPYDIYGYGVGQLRHEVIIPMKY